MAALERDLRAALGRQAEQIVARLRGLSEQELIANLSDPAFVPGLRREVETALRGRLAEIARLGAADAASDLPGVRFDLPHIVAQQWAADHAAELVTQIEDGSRELLRDEVSHAMQRPGGVDYAALRRRVQEVLQTGSEYRARRIAQTEPVIAYHNGSIQAYRESGQVWGRRWVDGQAGACRICSALHNQVARLGEPFRVVVDGQEVVVAEGKLAHPFDRCRIAPVTFSQAAESGYV